MKGKGLLFFIALVFSSLPTEAFVHQRTIYGTKFHWSNTSNITLHVNGANSSGIAESSVVSRAASAATQWNSTGGGPSLSVTSATTSAGGRSDVYFSSNPLFFSSTSVIAVTESVYNETSGQIIESDIIIKDSILFSNVSTTSPYIGDVLTHEMGHLLGMDHSTMPFASMFYRLSRGQHTVSFDDSLGLNSLYNYSDETGVISGTVAGGASQIGVFAADVQLISSVSGRVIATTLSDSDGSFSFAGIPINDTYYIYIKPLDVATAYSSYFQTVKNDFCTGFASYKGSFVESCDNSRKGYPQGITLNSSFPQRNIGTVTIKCNLDTPLNYFAGRDSGEFVLADADKKGDSFVGFFTESDIDDNKEDVITIDLSHVDSSSGNLYLDVSLLSQDFQSRVAYTMNVSSGAGSYDFSFSSDSDSNPNLNLKGRIPLDSSISANNVFTVTITPQDFDSFYPFTSFPLESYFFPDFENVGDERFFYQFIFFVGEYSGLNYSVNGHYNYPSPRGNSQCMEAQKTYGVKPTGAVTSVSGASTSKKAAESSAIACGSVALINDGDDSDGGSSTGASLLLGLLFSFLLFIPKRLRLTSF